MYEMTMDHAGVDMLGDVLAFVDGHLEEVDCPIKTQMQIDVAVEEVFVNIAHYAYAPETGPATICMEIDRANALVTITFIDEGMPFDPVAKIDPDVTLPASERQIGGLGIFMVKKSMDNMAYRREEGRNILTIQKRI